MKKSGKDWFDITSKSDIAKIIDESVVKPQIIFKHSTSCGVSSYAYERLWAGADILAQKADVNYLDLLAHRSVSNYIADELKVLHQSPQVILLKDKKVIYTVTHSAIDVAKILAHI